MPAARRNGVTSEVHPRHTETRECPYCHSPYVNNGAAWDEHKQSCIAYQKEMETMAATATKKTGTTKRSSSKKVVLTDEQKKKVVEAIESGHKLAWLDRDVLGLSGRASYVAVRDAAVEHFGSLDKVNAAVKAAQTKGEAKASATKTEAKAPAVKQAKPDPKPAAKRTTRKAKTTA